MPDRVFVTSEALIRSAIADEVERAFERVDRARGGQPRSAPEPEGWKSIRTFCKDAEIGRSTLSRWRKTGLVEEKPVGGRVFVRWAE